MNTTTNATTKAALNVGPGPEAYVHITEGADGTPTLCGYIPTAEVLTIPAHCIKYPGKPFCPACAGNWHFRK